jgi:hypothetical protein
MKTKYIILTTLLSLFIVSGLLAQNGERVYIREFSNSSPVKSTLFIYEKGESKQIEIQNPFIKRAESLKSFAEILEKYFQQGFKLLGTSINESYTEYILEKQ